MHILILPSEYFVPKNLPSAGVFQFDQAKNLLANGHKVGVLSLKPAFTFNELIQALLNRPNPYTAGVSKLNLISLFIRTLLFPKGWLLKDEHIDGVHVIRNIASYGFGNLKNQSNKLSEWNRQGINAFKKYVKKYGKPDIIHAHNMLYAGIVAKDLSGKFELPFTITEHSSAHVMHKMSENDTLNARHGFEAIRNVSFVSQSLANDIKAKYNLKALNMSQLPNLMDGAFEEYEDSFNKPEKEKVFLNIANLIDLKGQSILIKAFSKAFKGNELVKLKIGGDGKLMSSLNRQIVELGIEDQVEMLGALSRAEVLNEMKNANIFVLSSIYETFGVVLIEALAMGCSVIATKCGGPESIVNAGNGLLVKPNDVEDLSNGLLKIHSTYENYSPKKIRDTAIQQYGKEAFYGRVIKLYQNAINDYNN